MRADRDRAIATGAAIFGVAIDVTEQHATLDALRKPASGSR